MTLGELMYSGPTRLGTGMEIVPDLAESWTANDALTQWTFKLRAGARFHNGQPVADDDVAASLTAVLDKNTGSPGRRNLGPIESVDAMMAIPSLLFALLIVTVLGPSGVNAVIAIGIAFAPGIARVARSSTLSIRTSDYVAAAVARGESAGWIMLREVLPNMLAPVIIETTIRVAFAVMLLATLSFLRLGSQPPAPEWGLG